MSFIFNCLLRATVLVILDFHRCQGQESTVLNCDFHDGFCFYMEKLSQQITNKDEARNMCYKRYNGWLLEIYNQEVQNAVDNYLVYLGNPYALHNILLNVERSENRLDYIQNDVYPWIDVENELNTIYLYGSFAYYDSTNQRFSSDRDFYSFMDFQRRAYLCSNKSASFKCNENNSRFIIDQCFTAHTLEKMRFEAENDCLSRGRYLAIVRNYHLADLNRWLSRFITSEWWIGLAWKPIMWQHTWKFVTWTHFDRDYNTLYRLDRLYFRTNVNNHEWTSYGSLEDITLLMCMASKVASTTSDMTTTAVPTTSTGSTETFLSQTSELTMEAKVGIGLCVIFSFILCFISIVLYVQVVKYCFVAKMSSHDNNSPPGPEIIYSIPIPRKVERVSKSRNKHEMCQTRRVE